MSVGHALTTKMSIRPSHTVALLGAHISHQLPCQRTATQWHIGSKLGSCRYIYIDMCVDKWTDIRQACATATVGKLIIVDGSEGYRADLHPNTRHPGKSTRILKINFQSRTAQDASAQSSGAHSIQRGESRRCSRGSRV